MSAQDVVGVGQKKKKKPKPGGRKVTWTRRPGHSPACKSRSVLPDSGKVLAEFKSFHHVLLRGRRTSLGHGTDARAAIERGGACGHAGDAAQNSDGHSRDKLKGPASRW
eukprot:2840848-Rhodomonas_salina.1